LNSFLSKARRDGAFLYSFTEKQSVKHLIEAAGVPHTEVGLIQANKQPVDWNYQVQQDDQIEITPADASRDAIPGRHRFVADNHLGRLSAYLRMLGFDVIYRNNFDDEVLAQISSQEERILLTRDRRLLMRSIVRYGYCLRSLESRQQLQEVIRRYALSNTLTPFRRCLRCNILLDPVSKEAILDQLEPLTRLYYDEFHQCPICGQIYWKGSHYEHMQEIIALVYKSDTQAHHPGGQNGQ
jgi:uncharacterized protein